MEDRITKKIENKFILDYVKVDYIQDATSYIIKITDKRLEEFTFFYKWDYMIPEKQNLLNIEHKVILGILEDFIKE